MLQQHQKYLYSSEQQLNDDNEPSFSEMKENFESSIHNIA